MEYRVKFSMWSGVQLTQTQRNHLHHHAPLCTPGKCSFSGTLHMHPEYIGKWM